MHTCRALYSFQDNRMLQRNSVEDFEILSVYPSVLLSVRKQIGMRWNFVWQEKTSKMKIKIKNYLDRAASCRTESWGGGRNPLLHLNGRSRWEHFEILPRSRMEHTRMERITSTTLRESRNRGNTCIYKSNTLYVCATQSTLSRLSPTHRCLGNTCWLAQLESVHQHSLIS